MVSVVLVRRDHRRARGRRARHRGRRLAARAPGVVDPAGRRTARRPAAEHQEPARAVRNAAGGLLVALGVAVVYGVSRVEDKGNGDLMMIMGGGFLALIERHHAGAAAVRAGAAAARPAAGRLVQGVRQARQGERAVRNPRRTAEATACPR
ncbi:hypothetical protein ACU686_05840 [Yinghuangia aomiensis]